MHINGNRRRKTGKKRGVFAAALDPGFFYSMRPFDPYEYGQPETTEIKYGFLLFATRACCLKLRRFDQSIQ